MGPSISRDLFVLGDRVSVCRPGWPGTYYIDHAALELIVTLPPKC